MAPDTVLLFHVHSPLFHVIRDECLFRRLSEHWGEMKGTASSLHSAIIEDSVLVRPSLATHNSLLFKHQLTIFIQYPW